jgi:hypothetical protein
VGNNASTLKMINITSSLSSKSRFKMEVVKKNNSLKVILCNQVLALYTRVAYKSSRIVLKNLHILYEILETSTSCAKESPNPPSFWHAKCRQFWWLDTVAVIDLMLF